MVMSNVNEREKERGVDFRVSKAVTQSFSLVLISFLGHFLKYKQVRMEVIKLQNNV